MPPGRIGVFDANGHLRGHVGPKATSVTAARFTETHGAKLGKKNGRTAWLTPNQRITLKIAAATKAAREGDSGPASRRGGEVFMTPKALGD